MAAAYQVDLGLTRFEQADLGLSRSEAVEIVRIEYCARQHANSESWLADSLLCTFAEEPDTASPLPTQVNTCNVRLQQSPSHMQAGIAPPCN